MSDHDIRVLVADDDPHILRYLGSLLDDESGIRVVAVAANGNEALALLEQKLVDVVLLDVAMPKLDGIEAAQQISKRFPKIKIIMLTAFEHEGSLADSLAAGVAGFLTKDIAVPHLAEQIKLAYAGQPVFGPKPTQMLTSFYISSHQQPEEFSEFIAIVENLPNRLKSVFNLMAQGLSNKSIARELGCAEKTARLYGSEILALTGVESRSALAVTAIKAGLGG